MWKLWLEQVWKIFSGSSSPTLWRLLLCIILVRYNCIEYRLGNLTYSFCPERVEGTDLLNCSLYLTCNHWFRIMWSHLQAAILFEESTASYIFMVSFPWSCIIKFQFLVSIAAIPSVSQSIWTLSILVLNKCFKLSQGLSF